MARRRGLLSVLSVVLLAPPAFALPGYEKVLEQAKTSLAAGDLVRAEAACADAQSWIFKNRIPRPRNSKPVEPSFYARYFATCAVISLRAGDSERVSWRWHAARAFDAELASSTAAPLADPGALPSPRPPVNAGWRPGDRVRPLPLSSGPIGAFDTPPEQIGISTPLRLEDIYDLGKNCLFIVELVIGADGRPREPVVVRRDACAPTQVFAYLTMFDKVQYKPAKRAGEAVPALVIEARKLGLTRWWY